MILRLLLLFLTFFSFGSHLQAGMWGDIVNTIKGKPKPTPPNIRILIVHDVEGVHLEVKGKKGQK